MVNYQLFSSLVSRFMPRANARNDAGGLAYERTAEQALAQFAMTGTIHHTFYVDAEAQLEQVLALAARVSPTFVAQTAIHARRSGRMKDMPALLLATLVARDGAVFERAFDRVIDDARTLRAFVQIIRSGTVGVRSFGSRAKRCVRRWLAGRSEEQLFRFAIGTRPSLADVVRMMHPEPTTAERRAFYGWLLGREHDASLLPAIVREYEAWRRNPNDSAVPDVPFGYLAGVPLSRDGWARVARRASWNTLRMNLNTFSRHGVFEMPEVVSEVASKLRDPDQVRRARAFPYRLLAAYRNADPGLPHPIVDALHDALEVATENVPRLDGRIALAIDVSGSMAHPITGFRGSATSKVRCVDVAGLFAATLLRKNPSARVIVFSETARGIALDPCDTVSTNTERIAREVGGGTSVSSALDLLLATVRSCGVPDRVVILSDNESWVDSRRVGATATIEKWERLRRLEPRAKLALIDLTPNRTTQALERDDVMNVGGFSDDVFAMLSDFAEDGLASNRLAERIAAIEF